MIERAGFWRRAAAFLLDMLVVAVVLQCAAIAAFPLSNGHVQGSLGLVATGCRKLPEPPAVFEVPPTFQANFAFECRTSLLGLQTSHTVSIGRLTREGTVTKTASMGFMVDGQGKPIHALSLNLLWLPLLVALRWWADQRKGSPGRRACRIAVAAAATPDAAPSRAALTRRYAAFSLPGVPPWLFSGYESTFPSFAVFDHATFIPIWIGLSVVAVAAQFWALVSIVRGRDAYYDRFAATLTKCRGVSQADTIQRIAIDGHRD